MEILREELIESLKTRTELIKWKLLIVSVLGATGIGLTSAPAVPYIELVLCCIPFVCAYVDALAYHHGIAINIIGEFIRTRKASTDNQSLTLAEYEEFALKVRELKDGKGNTFSATSLERLVLFWSSIVFSSSILIYAVLHWLYRHQERAWIIGVSGIAGIIITVLMRKRYQVIREGIRKMNAELIEESANELGQSSKVEPKIGRQGVTSGKSRPTSGSSGRA